MTSRWPASRVCTRDSPSPCPLPLGGKRGGWCASWGSGSAIGRSGSAAPSACWPARRSTPESAARAGAAAGPDCDPPSDVHGSAEYRRHLATVLVERALLQAGARLA